MRISSIRAAVEWALRVACGCALGVALFSCASSSGMQPAPERAPSAAASRRGLMSPGGVGAPVYPVVVGVEYAELADPSRAAKLARMLAPLGASVATPHCEQVSWGQMQPAASAEIDFRKLDAFVRGFQSAGFRQLRVCLGTHSAWGSRDGSRRLRAKSPTPRPEQMEAFGRWVGAVVERYDADGDRDMPGLRDPVRLFQIGSAFSGLTSDFADRYLAMLERAYRAAHTASREVMIAHAALLTTGALRGALGPEDYDAAFAALSERVSLQGLPELRRLLDRPDIFDLLNVHAVGDAEETDATLAWLRWETDRRGYFKPIIVTQSAPAPLVGWGSATRCKGASHALGLVMPPASESDRCRLAGFFRELVNGRDAAVAWARGQAASDLVKKVVVAADRGAWLVSTTPIEDAQWWQRPALEASAGLSPWGGMLDVDHEKRNPVFYALRQLMNGLRGRDLVQRVPLEDDDVRLYFIDGPGGSGWIAWHEPGGLALPGDPAPKRAVSIGISGRRVRVEPIITRPGQALPKSRMIATQRGEVRLELTPTPVLLYPEI
jgi:hypothetical protein